MLIFEISSDQQQNQIRSGLAQSLAKKAYLVVSRTKTDQINEGTSNDSFSRAKQKLQMKAAARGASEDFMYLFFTSHFNEDPMYRIRTDSLVYFAFYG